MILKRLVSIIIIISCSVFHRCQVNSSDVSFEKIIETKCTKNEILITEDPREYIICSKDNKWVNYYCKNDEYFNEHVKTCIKTPGKGQAYYRHNDKNLCKGTKDNSLLPDPKSKDIYHICGKGKEFAARCTRGKIFHEKFKLCFTKSRENSAKSELKNRSCNDIDTAKLTDDPREYIICVNGTELGQYCNEHEYFDTVMQTCVSVPLNGTALFRHKTNICVDKTEKILPDSNLKLHVFHICGKGKNFAASCTPGYFFDSQTKACLSSRRTKTSIKKDESRGAIEAPPCKWSGIYELPNTKNYYYKCTKGNFPSFHQEILKCPENYNFHLLSARCIHKNNFYIRYHTVAAKSCFQYYFCVPLNSKSDTCQLRDCKEGRAYDEETKHCVPKLQIKCNDEKYYDRLHFEKKYIRENDSKEVSEKIGDEHSNAEQEKDQKVNDNDIKEFFENSHLNNLNAEYYIENGSNNEAQLHIHLQLNLKDLNVKAKKCSNSTNKLSRLSQMSREKEIPGVRKKKVNKTNDHPNDMEIIVEENQAINKEYDLENEEEDEDELVINKIKDVVKDIKNPESTKKPEEVNGACLKKSPEEDLYHVEDNEVVECWCKRKTGSKVSKLPKFRTSEPKNVTPTEHFSTINDVAKKRIKNLSSTTTKTYQKTSTLIEQPKVDVSELSTKARTFYMTEHTDLPVLKSTENFSGKKRDRDQRTNSDYNVSTNDENVDYSVSTTDGNVEDANVNSISRSVDSEDDSPSVNTLSKQRSPIKSAEDSWSSNNEQNFKSKAKSGVSDRERLSIPVFSTSSRSSSTDGNVEVANVNSISRSVDSEDDSPSVNTLSKQRSPIKSAEDSWSSNNEQNFKSKAKSGVSDRERLSIPVFSTSSRSSSTDGNVEVANVNSISRSVDSEDDSPSVNTLSKQRSPIKSAEDSWSSNIEQNFKSKAKSGVSDRERLSIPVFSTSSRSSSTDGNVEVANVNSISRSVDSEDDSPSVNTLSRQRSPIKSAEDSWSSNIEQNFKSKAKSGVSDRERLTIPVFSTSSRSSSTDGNVEVANVNSISRSVDSEDDSPFVNTLSRQRSPIKSAEDSWSSNIELNFKSKAKSGVSDRERLSIPVFSTSSRSSSIDYKEYLGITSSEMEDLLSSIDDSTDYNEGLNKENTNFNDKSTKTTSKINIVNQSEISKQQISSSPSKNKANLREKPETNLDLDMETSNIVYFTTEIKPTSVNDKNWEKTKDVQEITLSTSFDKNLLNSGIEKPLSYDMASPKNKEVNGNPPITDGSDEKTNSLEDSRDNVITKTTLKNSDINKRNKPETSKMSSHITDEIRITSSQWKPINITSDEYSESEKSTITETMHYLNHWRTSEKLKSTEMHPATNTDRANEQQTTLSNLKSEGAVSLKPIEVQLNTNSEGPSYYITKINKSNEYITKDVTNRFSEIEEQLQTTAIIEPIEMNPEESINESNSNENRDDSSKNSDTQMRMKTSSDESLVKYGSSFKSETSSTTSIDFEPKPQTNSHRSDVTPMAAVTSISTAEANYMPKSSDISKFSSPLKQSSTTQYLKSSNSKDESQSDEQISSDSDESSETTDIVFTDTASMPILNLASKERTIFMESLSSKSSSSESLSSETSNNEQFDKTSPKLDPIGVESDYLQKTTSNLEPIDLDSLNYKSKSNPNEFDSYSKLDNIEKTTVGIQPIDLLTGKYETLRSYNIRETTPILDPIGLMMSESTKKSPSSPSLSPVIGTENSETKESKSILPTSKDKDESKYGPSSDSNESNDYGDSTSDSEEKSRSSPILTPIAAMGGTFSTEESKSSNDKDDNSKFREMTNSDNDISSKYIDLTSDNNEESASSTFLSPVAGIKQASETEKSKPTSNKEDNISMFREKSEAPNGKIDYSSLDTTEQTGINELELSPVNIDGDSNSKSDSSFISKETHSIKSKPIDLGSSSKIIFRSSSQHFDEATISPNKLVGSSDVQKDSSNIREITIKPDYTNDLALKITPPTLKPIGIGFGITRESFTANPISSGGDNNSKTKSSRFTKKITKTIKYKPASVSKHIVISSFSISNNDRSNKESNSEKSEINYDSQDQSSAETSNAIKNFESNTEDHRDVYKLAHDVSKANTPLTLKPINLVDNLNLKIPNTKEGIKELEPTLIFNESNSEVNPEYLEPIDIKSNSKYKSARLKSSLISEDSTVEILSDSSSHNIKPIAIDKDKDSEDITDFNEIIDSEHVKEIALRPTESDSLIAESSQFHFTDKTTPKLQPIGVDEVTVTKPVNEKQSRLRTTEVSLIRSDGFLESATENDKFLRTNSITSNLKPIGVVNSYTPIIYLSSVDATTPDLKPIAVETIKSVESTAIVGETKGINEKTTPISGQLRGITSMVRNITYPKKAKNVKTSGSLRSIKKKKEKPVCDGKRAEELERKIEELRKMIFLHKVSNN